MANWWESAPIVQQQNWWESAPVVGGEQAPEASVPQMQGVPVPEPRPSDLSMTARDVAGGVGSGLVQGAAGVIGLPADMRSMASQAIGYGLDQTVGRVINRATTGSWDAPVNARRGLQGDNVMPGVNVPGSQVVQRAIEDNVTGPLPEPQTTAGGYARTIARNVPFVAAGPGTMMQKWLMAAVSGAAEETAGIATRGTTAEPYARFGAGLAAGLGTAMAMRPNYADRRVGNAVGNLTDEQAAAAQQLMREAKERGIDLTAAEAIQRVTNGSTGLGAVQRHVENLPGGAEVMQPFMAQRGNQVAGAVSRQLDEIAPAGARPQVLMNEARGAAEDILGGTRRAINEQTAPLYRAAEQARVAPQEMQALVQHPSYARAMQSIRSNPELSRFIGNLPDDSVAVVDKVKQMLSEESRRVGGPMSTAPFGQTRAAVMSEGADMARAAGTNASPEYARALAEQQRLRRDVLAPLEQGPLGRMAASTDDRAALNAFTPSQPLPGAANETYQAARALALRDQMMGEAGQATSVARPLARMSMEDQWNSITRGGGRSEAQASQFYGADFAKALRGDTGDVLDAAVRGAAGDATADRARRLAEVLAATGERQPAGSLTSYNDAAKREMQRGGVMGLLTGSTKPATALRDAYQQARMSKDASRIAQLLTAGDTAVPGIVETGRRVSQAERDMLARILQSFSGSAQPALPSALYQ